METPLFQQYLHRLPFSFYISSPLPNQHRHQSQNQNGGKSGSSMRFPILQKITSNRIITQSHHPKLFSVNNATFKDAMADEAKTQSQSLDESSALNTIGSKQDVEKQSENSPPFPPPPEKPLPGDCCGSGCVRCVWDIYYDELEEYNNLYKSKSDSVSNSKPS